MQSAAATRCACLCNPLNINSRYICLSRSCWTSRARLRDDPWRICNYSITTRGITFLFFMCFFSNARSYLLGLFSAMKSCPIDRLDDAAAAHIAQQANRRGRGRFKKTTTKQEKKYRCAAHCTCIIKERQWLSIRWFTKAPPERKYDARWLDRARSKRCGIEEKKITHPVRFFRVFSWSHTLYVRTCPQPCHTILFLTKKNKHIFLLSMYLPHIAKAVPRACRIFRKRWCEMSFYTRGNDVSRDRRVTSFPFSTILCVKWPCFFFTSYDMTLKTFGCKKSIMTFFIVPSVTIFLIHDYCTSVWS